MGAGVQTMVFGGSISGGKIDKNCAGLETARSFASVGSLISYCKVMVNRKYSKEAGVTLEDCMNTLRPTVTVAPAPQALPQSAPAPVAQPITIILPPTPAVPVATNAGTSPTTILTQASSLSSSGVLRDLGDFTITRLTSTGTCPTVAVQLGARGIAILNKAVSSGDEIILTGDTRDVAVATGYLKRHGVTRVSVHLQEAGSVNVSIWEVK
jgi:hypothetical protein